MTIRRSWFEAYMSAVLETDWSKMEQQIETAETEISTRLHEFSTNHHGTPEENRAIEAALNGLKALREDVAAWQGSRRTG